MDLVWVVAGAEGIGMAMAATGTVMVVNTTVAPGIAAAAGMPLVDIIVVDMVEVGTTSRFEDDPSKRSRSMAMALRW